MSTTFKFANLFLSTVAIASISLPVAAQNIIPNAETNTVVNYNNDLYTITGGALSADQLNLFHKFQEFNLDINEIADFQTNANLLNLLVGVDGGNPSFINGLLQLSGSNANFYFLNPSGVIFGQSAVVNLPADLTVSTANRVGFSEDKFFDIFTTNDYGNLLGNPISFIFDASEPSAIINEGNLTLNNGDLAFYSGGITHTGKINAGDVTLQAVEGSTATRILPKGSALGFEIDLPTNKQGEIQPFGLRELREILLSSDEQENTYIEEIETSQTPTTLVLGDVSTASQIARGGDIKILGEQVILDGQSQINASGELGGGDINIGGNYQGEGELPNAQSTFIGNDVSINADALTDGDGGEVIVWANERTDFLGTLSSRGGEVSGDGGFAEISGKNKLFYRGNVDLGANNGEIGTLLFDPIDIEISDQPTATFSEANIENGTVANLNFEATNDITFGTFADGVLAFPRSDIDINFTANSDGMDGGDIMMLDTTQTIAADSNVGNLTGRTITFSGENVTIGNVSTRSGINGTAGNGNPAPGGTVVINATGNVQTGTIETFADSDQSSNSPRIDNSGSAGNIQITTIGGNITTETLSANAAEGSPGDITLQANGNILVAGNLEAGTVFSEGGSGGAITVISNQGSVTVEGRIGSTTGLNTFTGESSIGGDTILRAFGDLSLQRVSTTANNNMSLILPSDISQSGNISLISDDGNIIVGDGLTTVSRGNSGDISISATQGNVGLNGVVSSSSIGTGTSAGDINITAVDILIRGGVSALGSSAEEAKNFSSNTVFNGNLLISALSTNSNGDLTISTDNVQIDGNINGVDENQSLDISARRNISLLGTVGNQIPLRNLRFSGSAPSQAEISGDILVDGDLEFFGMQAYILSDVTLRSRSGNLLLNRGLEANSDVTFKTNNLEIRNADENSIFIGNNKILSIHPESLDREINLGMDTTNQLSISGTELALIDGFSSIEIGRIDGTGNININAAISPQDPLTLQTTNNINVNANIIGTDDASLTLAGTTLIANTNTISTIGQNITVNGNVTLLDSVAVETNSGDGNINFNGTVTGNQILSTTSGTGSTSFGDLIAVFDIDIGEANNVDLGGDLSISNPDSDLELNNPTTLTNNVELTTSGGNIAINNTVNSQANTNFNLGLNPAGGNAELNGEIGGIQPIAEFTISNAQTVNISAPITTENGNVDITADGAIVAIADLTTNGGDINLRSNNSNITTQNLDTSDAGGVGGNVTAIALGNETTRVETNNINTSGDTGGNINLQANQAVIAAEINARGLVNDGGDVTIDPEELVVTSIDAQGGAFGFGGDVDLTSTGFFRATDGFIDDSGTFSSIATLGGLGSGSITIRHDGGDRLVNFIVGDPSINGTAGALNTGDFIIAPFQVFPGSFFLGNISIITSDRLSNLLNQEVSTKIPELEPASEPTEKGFFIDEYFTRTFERFFNDDRLAAEQRIKSLSEIRNELADIEEATGVKPTLVYGLFQPQSIVDGCRATGEAIEKLDNFSNNTSTNGNNFKTVRSGEMIENEDQSCLVNPDKLEKKEEDILTLVTVTSNGAVRISIVPDATRKSVEQAGTQLRRLLTNSITLDWNYEPAFRGLSTRFYKWLISDLNLEESQQQQNLTFILDDSLRILPIAAFGQENQDCIEPEVCMLNYVIRDYSIGLMPSMSLTETKYQKLTDLDLRVAGSQSVPGQAILPSVPIEIKKLAEIWQGEEKQRRVNQQLQDQNFTIEALKTKQKENPYGFVHLTTHADFSSKDESYIAFNPDNSNPFGKLKLEDVRTMSWNDVNLLILDACKTVLGNNEAELGFAGFAHRAQTSSVLGTLWKVPDTHTTTFMVRLYQVFDEPPSNPQNELGDNIIKAEALRVVQNEMLDKKLIIEQSANTTFALYNGEPSVDFSDLPRLTGTLDLSNPYFWSTFTLVGSPW